MNESWHGPADWDPEHEEWICQAHGMPGCEQEPECISALAVADLQSQLADAAQRERELRAEIEEARALIPELTQDAESFVAHLRKFVAMEAVVAAAQIIDQQAPLDHEHRELRAALDALDEVGGS